MKKLFELLCAAAVMLSCAKNGPDASVTFHVTADAPATKASAKSAWADGDVVYIVFQGISNKYLYITYDGATGEWVPAESSPFAASDFEEKTLQCTAIHYPVPVDAYMSTFLNLTEKGGDQRVNTYFLYKTGVDYTVSGTDVSIHLSLSIADGFVQFHVPGIQASPGAYTLQVNGVKPRNARNITGSGFLVSDGTDGAKLKGFADSEGVIFGGYVVNPDVSTEYTFVLTGPDKVYTLTRTLPLIPGTFYRLPGLTGFDSASDIPSL